MTFLLRLLAALLTASSALPTIPQHNHVVHEKRDYAPAKWTKRSRMAPSAVLPVRVGMTQRNLHRGAEFLNDVSNPRSKNYGKHWSMDKVRETFAPSDETRESVLQWLSESGITSVRHEGALHTLAFDLPVSDVERLLKTKYYVYEHDESGEAHVACEQYSVPEHISKHINVITPTLHFENKLTRHGSKSVKRTDFESHPSHEEIVSESEIETADAGDEGMIAASDGSFNVQDCSKQITPACLRALYNIPEATTTPSSNNSFGIQEFNDNSYTPADLDQFFTSYAPAAVGSRPKLVSIAGGALTSSNPSDFNTHGESNLDLEYAMAMVYPQAVTLYQVGNNQASNGSTDPEQYMMQTKVVSTSWGSNENQQTSAMMDSLCLEYMKLGLQGVTVLFSTGDNGVGGNGDCKDNKFQPDWPATCPYVTAVGATQVDTSVTDIASTLSKGGQVEVAINTTIRSGGGFSQHFATPDYQNASVQTYLSNHAPTYTADRFESRGRAIPDISLNGHAWIVINGGAQTGVDGTSASTPLLGSMITMINQARLAAGKGTVGFINPVLYAHKDAYIKDVTVGTNPGCGTNGFSAVSGWDPVTGLGTPDYQKLLAVFMDMP
ncbi:subtilisin-like protein [Pleomassaria siparia CBS 279.74]|uniref:tripeptidyl-peptidase II n=1 Tax=Pleomassaria siparia CBS 279.74 TaxID=1314801 RepID=A0A6G1JXJ1_9PLEO|nr:subtilisin-like protein [Pleomassaria siparia CBS 279.74]